MSRQAPSRMSDAELVQRCKEHSDEAWNELVERFSRYVYAICTRGFGLAGFEAEDAFQEVFLRIYSRLDQLRDEASIRPWIAQLTRRVCLDAIASGPTLQPLDDVAEEQVEHLIAELDEAFSVRQAMETLGDPCRDLLDRFFARDESYRTIGGELGIPFGTIASRISRCLDKLRTELEGRNPGQPPSSDQ